MHPTAMDNAAKFYQTYLPVGAGKVIVEIGSQDVNGSIRSVAPSDAKYIGVDFAAGKGVDVIIDDPYNLPFENESVDICTSSSVFEHSEMFWLLFLEILRILKPGGLFYLNVPSNGDFHRYPVDCWRFYPDAGKAMISWAKRNQYTPCMLESFVSSQNGDIWNDFVAIYLKNEKPFLRLLVIISPIFCFIRSSFFSGVILDFTHFSSMALPANFIALILSVCLLMYINMLIYWTKNVYSFFIY